MIVQQMREWGAPLGWEVVSDLRDAGTKTQEWLRAEGVFTDRRVDVLLARRERGRVRRVIAVELSVVWEGMSSRFSDTDVWAKEAAAAGRKWSTTIERRAAAKKLKYDRDVLDTFPPQWRTSVITLEIGARGLVPADVVRKLTQLCTEISPRRSRGHADAHGKIGPGPRKKAADFAITLGERAMLGSYVIWQKRKQDWDTPEVCGTIPTQPMEERGLSELDAIRQRRVSTREKAAGTINPKWIDLDRTWDDHDAAHATELSEGNATWRKALLDVRHRAESDDAVLRVYTDGSYAGGFAGWGWIAVRGSEVVARRSGPVVTETSDPAWVGCNFASNNAGEVSAVVHAAEWLAARPANEPRAIVPDSWWAIAVTKGRWVARYHRAAARRASCAAAASRAELGWIKGHSDHV